VSLLDTHRFSIVLLDYNLGGLRTGLDFCRHIRAGGHLMPVIVTTANDSLDETAIREAGAQDLIRKNSEFINRLTTLIDSFFTIEKRLVDSDL
jgi:CheY-like chemotaxis protein